MHALRLESQILQTSSLAHNYMVCVTNCSILWSRKYSQCSVLGNSVVPLMLWQWSGVQCTQVDYLDSESTKKAKRTWHLPMIIVSVIDKSLLSSCPDDFLHTAAFLLLFMYLLCLHKPVVFTLVEQQSILCVCIRAYFEIPSVFRMFVWRKF
jgi:hypothetical protein